MTTPEQQTAPPAASGRWSSSSILKNVTWNWAGLIVGIVLSFVLAPVTVESLGTVHYGIWTLLTQFTGYLWLFDFGVRESVVKYVAQYEASNDRERIIVTVRTAVSLYGVVSLATLILSIALAVALPYVFNIPIADVWTARVTTLLVGATVAQVFVFNVFIGVLMALQRFYVMARVNMVLGVLRGVAVYLMMKAGYGIVALAVMQFAVTLAGNLLVLWMAMQALPYLSIRPHWPERAEAAKLLNYGKYVLISNVGDKLVFATDSIVIGMFQPIAALTYYAIGGSLIEQFRGFITSMATVVNPLSSSLQAKNDDRAVATVVQTGVRAAILLGLPVSIGFIFLGKAFISLWMGPEYAGPASEVLAWLAVGHLLGLPYYTISAALYGLGRHRVVAQTRVADGVVNLTLSMLLVRSLGINGVAIGTIIPHTIVVVGVLPMVLARWVPINLREYYTMTYVRPILASLPFGLVCWLIARVIAPDGYLVFFASVGIGLLAYIVPAWFVALTPPERERLGQALRDRLLPKRQPAESLP